MPPEAGALLMTVFPMPQMAKLRDLESDLWHFGMQSSQVSDELDHPIIPHRQTDVLHCDRSPNRIRLWYCMLKRTVMTASPFSVPIRSITLPNYCPHPGCLPWQLPGQPASVQHSQ